MSHFSVVVCLDDPEKLDAVMAPYDENLAVAPYRDYLSGAPCEYRAVSSLRKHEGLSPDDATLTWAQVAEASNRRYADELPILLDDEGRPYSMSTRNPDSKWDYWRIGGRWRGYFPYKAEDASRVVRSGKGWDSPDLKPLHCDGGPKRALDLGLLRDLKAAEARARHAEFHALIAECPTAESWAAYLKRRDNGEITIDEVRSLYHAQPAVQAIAETDFEWMDDPFAELGVPEALYAERQRASAVPGYATITLDGRWLANGTMGWFGMSHEDAGGFGYVEAANAYIDSLSDETYLIVTDCHI